MDDEDVMADTRIKDALDAVERAAEDLSTPERRKAYQDACSAAYAAGAHVVEVRARRSAVIARQEAAEAAKIAATRR